MAATTSLEPLMLWFMDVHGVPSFAGTPGPMGCPTGQRKPYLIRAGQCVWVMSGTVDHGGDATNTTTTSTTGTIPDSKRRLQWVRYSHSQTVALAFMSSFQEPGASGIPVLGLFDPFEETGDAGEGQPAEDAARCNVFAHIHQKQYRVVAKTRTGDMQERLLPISSDTSTVLECVCELLCSTFGEDGQVGRFDGLHLRHPGLQLKSTRRNAFVLDADQPRKEDDE